MKNLKLRRFIQHFGFLFNYHKPKKSPNVLVFSIPRSGSTWVMELIWSQPGFKYVNEPLNLKGENSWEQKRSGVNGFNQLYTEKSRKKVVDYFKGFVKGKYHYMNPNPLRKTTRFLTSRIVFKVIHGGELFINNISKETNSKIIYLIRNPIDVALSRKQITRTVELTSDFVMSRFTTDQQELARTTIASGTDMEKKIMLWCIQNKLALSQRTKEWLVISYEELTCNPQKVLKNIAEHCQLPDLNLMLNNVNVPSAVTTQSEDESISLMQDDNENRLKLVNKWRTNVSPQDAKRYFEICEKMNFNIYTETNDIPNLISI